VFGFGLGFGPVWRVGDLGFGTFSLVFGALVGAMEGGLGLG
jgi:hypothetical protein